MAGKRSGPTIEHLSKKQFSQRRCEDSLPILLNADETACLLRTTRTAVYAMAARGALPGVTRLGRRLLVRSADLLDWLDQKRAPSPEDWR